MLGMGDVAERRGDYAGALAWDRRAATLIDTLRARQGEEAGSITLFSNRLFAYEALVHLLGRLDPQFPDSNYAAEAFQWAERARARSFLDQVRGAPGAAAVTPLSLEEARGLLRSDREALLEYSLGDSSTSLWVVTRKAWRRFTLPPRPALRSRCEVLRRGLGVPASADSRATRAAARALCRALVEPAEPMLAGVRHLVIAPDGPLARVPFEVYSPAEPGNAWTTGRTDRDGWLAFVPDRPGRWRVRVIEATGHGLDVGVEALAPPAAPPAGAAPGPSSAASLPADRPASPGASYLVRLVLGLAVLGAVFAALVLARRKRDARGP
jgi:nickel transport protein